MSARLLVYFLVFVSGGCVLAIEILGTRILGPSFGVSLFLWSALITVTLAALSVGYAVGGRWADAGARMGRLAAMLAFAGVWMLLVPWIKRPLLDATYELEMRSAVLITSLLLFAPPLAALGTISPLAIRIRAESLSEVGRTAGDLYALSTLASVVAALATGFWLIPAVGIQRLTLAIGLVLIGAALVARLVPSGRRPATVALLLCAALVAIGASVPVRGAARSDSIVFAGQSPYAQIRVMDRESARYLLIDGGVHTSESFADGGSYHPYVAVLDLAKAWFDEPGRVLLIGLGGGSVAVSYAQEGWIVDAVEIDPLVARVAHSYFELEPGMAAVHVMDGRRFLVETEHRYDLIVFDAFGSSSIPFHLITREVFALVRERMAADGVFAINVEAQGWRHPLVLSTARTLRTSFQHVIALPMAEPPSSLGNVVLFAMDRDDVDAPESSLVHPGDVLYDEDLHYRTVERFHAWNSRFEPEEAGALLLTDDRNPADVWADAINRVARAQLFRDFYHEDELGW